MDRMIPEFGRSAQNLPMMSLYNLKPEHINELRGLLVENGKSSLHEMRAEAGAHLLRWTPEDGIVEVEFHGENPWMFIEHLCKVVDASVQLIPNQFPEPLDS